MRTPLLLLASVLLSGCASPTDDSDSDDVAQGKKINPTDETALLNVTVPAGVLLKSTASVTLPGVNSSTRTGEWVFEYVLESDRYPVVPGTPVAVRPGGCLYTSYRSQHDGSSSYVADKDCDLGLVGGQSKTYALGAVRLHYATEPLRVDFGKRARPHLDDANGNAMFASYASLEFGRGSSPTFSDHDPTEAFWELNLQTFDVALDKPADFLAAPIRPGSYTFKFETYGLASKQVTVAASKIAELDATPTDVRSTLQFSDDDPAPFAQAAAQLLELRAGGVDPGQLEMRTGGFDAKFLPSGSAGDEVSYAIKGTNLTNLPTNVKVSAKGTSTVVLPRVDVDDVKVNDGGAGTQTVRGRWKLEKWDVAGAAWLQVGTSSGGAWNLATKAGLYVVNGNKYRATVTYRTNADPNDQTKIYEVSFP